MNPDALIETTVVTSAALLLVLVLRPRVRRVFGASAAYALWLLVPLTLVAVLFPAATLPAIPTLVNLGQPQGMTTATGSGTAAGPDLLSALPWLWAIGCLLMFAWLGRQQWRFLADLGPVTSRPDGFYQSLATRGLPAVIGLRPKIVLPGDFEVRYDALERELVLAHEAEHLRRGDLPACALAFVLRALFWFNPLVHFAVARFRQDQELACDAAVLRRYPLHRRLYGDAMLKTQLADQPLPLGCHWSGFHPLKERLAMLKNPLPSRRRQFVGFVLVCLLGVVVAAVAWAAQPATFAGLPPGKLGLEVMIKVDGEHAQTTKSVIAPGESHRQQFDHDGQAWDISWTIDPLADGTFDLQSLIRRDGEVIGEPRMIVRDQAAIGIGDQRADGSFKGIEIELAVTMGPPGEGMAAAGIEGARPDYPKTAADAGQGGMVMLNVLVGSDGRAEDVQFVADKSSVPADSEFVRNTLEAAKSWKFQPEVKDGKPVKSRVLVPVRFDPPNAADEQA